MARESLFPFRFRIGLLTGMLFGAVASNINGAAGWIVVGMFAFSLACFLGVAIKRTFKVVRRG